MDASRVIVKCLLERLQVGKAQRHPTRGSQKARRKGLCSSRLKLPLLLTPLTYIHVGKTAPTGGSESLQRAVGRKSAASSDKAFAERPKKGAVFFAVETAPTKDSDSLQ